MNLAFIAASCFECSQKHQSSIALRAEAVRGLCFRVATCGSYRVHIFCAAHVRVLMQQDNAGNGLDHSLSDVMKNNNIGREQDEAWQGKHT